MEEAVHTFRESNRNMLNVNRRRLRDEETDVRRSLANLRISPEDVADIANKLKSKSMVSVNELRKLKNAIIEDEKNIEVVLNSHGALRGLVRELSGHNERNQCEAAGCCCNLALGDSGAGAVVAKAAGPYLIAALNNLTTYMAVTCTWTLGNLSVSGAKANQLLVAQGAIGKLIDQLTVPNEDLSGAAVEALTQFAYQMQDGLSSEHYHGILSKLQDLPITMVTLNLLFVLSCHKDFSVDNMKAVYVEKILKQFYSSIRTLDDEKMKFFIYLLRILGNFHNKIIYGGVLNYFVMNNMSYCVKELLNNSRLSETLYWLLGNMFNLCHCDEFFVVLLK